MANDYGRGSGGDEQDSDGSVRRDFALGDSDRLPWLEPAEPEYDKDGVSRAKIVGLVVLGLVLLALIVGGGYWMRSQRHGDPGEAKLIPAQGGAYKIAANDSAARPIKGEGDTSYATSEGVDTNGRVDASRMPEAPMEGVSRGSIAKEKTKEAGAKPAAEVTAAVRDETKTRSATPKVAGAPGGAMVQLGAYGSDAVARDAWNKLAKRFAYLAPLSSSVEKAQVGGTTVYRLRASAGSASNASTLCGRLKVAGENCIVVK